MFLCSQFEDGAAKKVELHGHLDRHGWVNDGGQLVGGKDSQGIVDEIEDGNELGVTNLLESIQG